jgi:CTP-dependent riboflavin kinase
MLLYGTLNLSDANVSRNSQRFAPWMTANSRVLSQYFGVELFPGSLNVLIREPSTLQTDLDSKKPPPTIIIPRDQLVLMAPGLGDGQSWACKLASNRLPTPIDCWVFRRIGSKVPSGIIEIIAREPLVRTYGLLHGDEVSLEVLGR